MVDLSADYRLDSAASYQQWYEHEHPDPNRLGSTVYGLPEFYREDIKKAFNDPEAAPSWGATGLGRIADTQ